MSDAQRSQADLAAVSRAVVAIHKEQFGRGPVHVRSHFAGRDTLVCILEGAMLPAETKQVELGEASRVRETRVAYQAATEGEFVSAIEQLLHREVRAFSSAIAPETNLVYEIFTFQDGEEPLAAAPEA